MGKPIKIYRIKSTCGKLEVRHQKRERTINYFYYCGEEKPPIPSALKDESASATPKRSRKVDDIVAKYHSEAKRPRTGTAAVDIVGMQREKQQRQQ